MPSYASVILAEPTLVAYWQLNEIGGTTAFDSKGTNHGTYNGGFTLNQGGAGPSMGGSALLDGSTGYVAVPTDSRLHPTLAYTVEAWVYVVAIGVRVSHVAGVAYSSGPIYTFDYQITTGSYPHFPTGGWHHLAQTLDGSTLIDYLDGVVINSRAFPGGPPTSGNPFVMGGFSGGGGTTVSPFLDGLIGHVALYNSALSAPDIVAHYNAAANPLPGSARLSQLPIEVVRGQIAGKARLNQLCVEVLVPHVAASTHTFTKAASAQAKFHPSAAATKSRGASTGTASVVFHPSGTSFKVPAGLYRAATATVVFSAQAVLANVKRGVQAACMVIFKARAKDKVKPIVFGDDYLGRFAVGSEIPLWVAVRDQHGSLALPTTTPPVADIYNLDARTHVDSVEVSRLRGSRNDSVYAMSYLLGRLYSPARYAVLYRATTGGFTGFTLSIFEVVPGGDPSGPVIASHTFDADAGDQVMAHLGSGSLAKGTRARLS